MVNKRKEGNDFEKLAAIYLKEQGFQIIDMNFYCKIGEIDIVALDQKMLVFVEVKYRSNAKSGLAVEAVSFNKMRKISKTADYYLMTHNEYANKSVRFDVIAIDGGKLNHIRNAFEYVL